METEANLFFLRVLAHGDTIMANWDTEQAHHCFLLVKMSAEGEKIGLLKVEISSPSSCC